MEGNFVLRYEREYFEEISRHCDLDSAIEAACKLTETEQRVVEVIDEGEFPYRWFFKHGGCIGMESLMSAKQEALYVLQGV